ncbi:hypothetical protein Avbf_03830 [Armadillidium vulgare]|nr:hypothetical protein Avbf_03830 [Armadillidium vulgare]
MGHFYFSNVEKFIMRTSRSFRPRSTPLFIMFKTIHRTKLYLSVGDNVVKLMIVISNEIYDINFYLVIFSHYLQKKRKFTHIDSGCEG